MATRLQVTLNREERAGLDQLANRELRNSRAQLLHILRKELERQGLLPGNGHEQQRSREDATC